MGYDLGDANSRGKKKKKLFATVVYKKANSGDLDDGVGEPQY